MAAGLPLYAARTQGDVPADVPDCQPQGASPIGCCLAEANLQSKGSGPSGDTCFGAFWCSREVTVFLAPGAALGPFRAASPRPFRGAVHWRRDASSAAGARRLPAPQSPRGLGVGLPCSTAEGPEHGARATANAGAGSCVKHAGTAPRGASAGHRRALVGRTMPPPVLSLCRAVACARAKRGRGGVGLGGKTPDRMCVRRVTETVRRSSMCIAEPLWRARLGTGAPSTGTDQPPFSDMALATRQSARRRGLPGARGAGTLGRAGGRGGAMEGGLSWAECSSGGGPAHRPPQEARGRGRAHRVMCLLEPDVGRPLVLHSTAAPCGGGGGVRNAA